MSVFTRAPGKPGKGDSDFPGDDEQTVRITQKARKRFARRQWARRWLAWRRVLVALLVVALLAGSAWLVFFSSVLAVAGARVEGAAVLDPAVVRRAAEVPVGSPLATADLDAISERVEALPAVASVDVSRSWPDQVRIDVTERQAVAVVDQQDGLLRGVDASGVVFRTFPQRPRGLPVIRVERETGADALSEAATVAGALPADLSAKVANISVATVDTISLELRSGRTVRWGSADDSRSKARVLAVLLSQRARVYDVRVPGQPVITK